MSQAPGKKVSGKVGNREGGSRKKKRELGTLCAVLSRAVTGQQHVASGGWAEEGLVGSGIRRTGLPGQDGSLAHHGHCFVRQQHRWAHHSLCRQFLQVVVDTLPASCWVG